MREMDLSTFMSFNSIDSAWWGELHYRDWLPTLHNQEYKPATHLEKFFRYYTQGIHYVYNQKLRLGIAYQPEDEYDQERTSQIVAATDEIKKHLVPENIIAYRYVNKSIFRSMCQWGVSSKNLMDKAFLSTTLSPEIVKNRGYAQDYHKFMKIYIPQGTPAVYLDLISDMSEREVLLLPDTKLRIVKSSMFSRVVECVVII